MSNDDFKQAALEYHRLSPPGKIKVSPTKPMLTQRDLALAYSPGVAYACEAIVEDPNAASEMTARGNLVAVVSNGTAVLGLGNIGALAGKPVMEGKGVLFQKFAGIDVFDIEIDETDPDKLVDIIASLEPTFGGINLEDIKAPECFIVERKLRERMKIPVFHDDQHGTAIIVGAAVVNALEVVGKKIEDVKLATSGAGAAGIACLDMLVALGLKPENILAVDRDGVLYTGRPHLDPDKARYARDTDKRTLAEIVDGADLFLGLSAANVLKPEMVATMADKPIILALANPNPEILPELARQVRPDCIIATGRSDYPNQVNNAVCFPYIFRGALDVGATGINEAMKLACVHAIADLARREASDLGTAYGDDIPCFGPEYLIPRPFDPRLLVELAPAVAKAAMDSGVALRPMADLQAYREKLGQFVYRTSLMMKPVYDRARADRKRVAYAEGEEETVLRAVQTVIDEGLAFPILIGRPDVIDARIERLGLRMRAGVDFELTNINDDPRFNDYWQYYHALTARRGVTPAAAKNLMRSRPTLIAAVMVARGEADAMVSGIVGRFHKKLGYVRSVIPLDPGVQSTSAMTGVINNQGAYFFLDTHVQEDPTAEQIAEATLQAAYRLKLFGIEPRIALLSHSNFGSHETRGSTKMRQVRELLLKRKPDLNVDGEMQGDTAWDEALRQRIMPGSTLSGRANLFVLPNLDAANITYNMVRVVTDGVAIGPILMGISKPVHILTTSATPRRVVNMTAIAAVDAQIRAQLEAEKASLG
ncbi:MULTISPECIES: NADP-dependent malic enzyme [Pseudoxanthomonas]|jgi:malate dehydrogenase (oxaloacetate-decarboxylating)(NADP+)|uniref:NADP-dependent malic enzyme n=1 Tax=Pseudoxanthomonas TaxID=83618 RepID=UPI00160A5E6D|nr:MULTISPECIES: NADP-dependent malic enzyme [Pseudoxanthomonas]MBB3276576.1 malate dehydrogenase (oxaloacetate-decarboxylating)(NADP+) [Pseudoxanthomonas sp. OG2]MBD9378642.1 NADP-dependent malic enzyme [Pseudoxanthomonas sp. PXM04]MBV7472349.1 NADP-dependent malic enzyme [Pseudoxanthomonas sp. PXM05]UBB25426.1 NADP-dependent malic enzyme [Pseudoxanthomonas japonensis]